MTEELVDPLAGRTGTTALQLLRLSDDDVRRYVAYWEQKQATHRAAGRAESSWWSSKSVTGGLHELRQRGIDRYGAPVQREHGLPRAAALRVTRGRGEDAAAETWVRDSTYGWVHLEDEDDPRSSLAEVFSEVDAGLNIEIAGPGCTLDDVLAALPRSDADGDEYDECVVSIDSVVYGRFSKHGWFRFDDEREDLPAYHPLVEMTFSEEGGFTSGMFFNVLGEVRPGLLLRYWNLDGMDRGLEIFSCDPAEYVQQMRSELVADIDLQQLGVDRALVEGSGGWTGDELDPEEGSPMAYIGITYDETLLPPTG